MKHFSKVEKRAYTLGIILMTFGFITLVIITKIYGYYFFNNGAIEKTM